MRITQIIIANVDANMTEKLNLWDRIFNRYKRVILEEGMETWYRTYTDYIGVTHNLPNSDYVRSFVKYKVIDRVTGSETIEKVYLS